MGAFGAALIAKEQYKEGYKSTLLDLEHLKVLIMIQVYKDVKDVLINVY